MTQKKDEVEEDVLGGWAQEQGRYGHLTLKQPVRIGEAFHGFIPQLYYSFSLKGQF